MTEKLKKFRVQKRFEVWCETEIRALSIEDAVADGKGLRFSDFYSERSGVDTCDLTELSGTTVGEAW